MARSVEEMKDIINNELTSIYDRTEGEDDIREVLELESVMEMECRRREMDARALIRGDTPTIYTAADRS